MKKKSAFLALAFAIASPTAALEFPGVDTCTAAIAGHAVAVYNYNQCKSAYPPQPCYSEYVAMTYATNQVLYWCFGVQA